MKTKEQNPDDNVLAVMQAKRHRDFSSEVEKRQAIKFNYEGWMLWGEMHASDVKDELYEYLIKEFKEHPLQTRAFTPSQITDLKYKPHPKTTTRQRHNTPRKEQEENNSYDWIETEIPTRIVMRKDVRLEKSSKASSTPILATMNTTKDNLVEEDFEFPLFLRPKDSTKSE